MKHTTETGHNEYQHIENQELFSESFKTPTLERLTKPKIENSSSGVYFTHKKPKPIKELLEEYK